MPIMWQKQWGNFTDYFLRGLITLLPLLVTIWLLWFMFTFLDGILGNFISLFWKSVPGVGFVLIFLVIFLAGYFSNSVVTNRLFVLGEKLLSHVPVIKSIYSAAKQINDVLFVQKNAEEYRRACIVEYPRKGIWSIGFVTSDASAEIEAKAKEKMINVFIANTPTPATGFLIMVPAREVILLDMKMEEAFKYVVSGGVLKPDLLPKEVMPKREV